MIKELNMGITTDSKPIYKCVLVIDNTQPVSYTHLLEETREEHYPLKELNINTLCESIMEKAKINFKSGVEAVVNVPRVSIKTNAEALQPILNHLLNNAAD